MTVPIFNYFITSCFLIFPIASYAIPITDFTLTEVTYNGHTLKAYFNGTSDGATVTSIRSLSVHFDDVAYTGNGSLYAGSMDADRNWVTGGAVVGFDPFLNNFMFIDVNYPLITNFTNYWYDLRGIQFGMAAYNTNTNQMHDGSLLSEYNLTTNNIPEPTSIVLLSSGLLGFVTLRRKKNKA